MLARVAVIQRAEELKGADTGSLRWWWAARALPHQGHWQWAKSGSTASGSDGGLVAAIRRPHASNETSTIEAPTREQVQRHANDRVLRVVNS